jgi:predicted RNase H-like nuclease (RuvC/YqgF family)
MHLTIFLRTTALLSAGLIAALSTPAQDPSSQQAVDPLAAAARKARAEQQSAPKPKKVYTNDDFAPPPAAKATDAKPAAQAGSAATSDAELAAENDPKTEIYWRKRFSKVRDKLATAEKEVAVLQREFDKDEVQYYPDPQKALMQQYTRKDINDKRAKLDAKQKEVDSLKKQLSDMEDELRRAGGDPGWAR